MRWSLIMSLCGLLATLASGATQARAAILAPGDSYAGRTYNDWQVVFWQTGFATPIVGGDHPFFSGGVLGEVDGVVMLTGVVGVATLDLTISENTAILFPILNIESSVFEAPPFHGDDEASLTANSVALLDQTSGLFAEIDGAPVADLTPFRFISPLFTWGPVPANNIVGAPAGTTSDAVDAGYYLLLTPLSVGNHTIRFGGDFGGPLSGFSIDTTYNITVHAVPEPMSMSIWGIGAIGLLGARRLRRKIAK